MKINSHILLLFAIVFLVSITNIAQSQGLGDGSDGSPSISGIINSYTAVTSISVSGCQSVVNVSSASSFAVNDLVLIIQMQGAIIDTSNTTSYGSILNYNSAGNFEFAKISSISGGALTLQGTLINTYNTATGHVQLINVPQYANPTISGQLTCSAWNGTTGGVLALDATGTITMNSSIDCSGKGFRGGTVQLYSSVAYHLFNFKSVYTVSGFAAKGEGISQYGQGLEVYGRGAPANGGGGGNTHNAGGGGGGSFGAGGLGGAAYTNPNYGTNAISAQGIGGYNLNNIGNNKLFLGGGGGAGHQNDALGGVSGNGGGVIIIHCNSLSCSSSNIYSIGTIGGSAGIDGGSGGGAGGSVLIVSPTFTGTMLVDLHGGNGGNSVPVAGYAVGTGGGGGGGLLWLSVPSLPIGISTNLNGGIKGNSNGMFSGETDGAIGGVLYNYIAPTSSTQPSGSSTSLNICAGDSIQLAINPSSTSISWSPTLHLSCTNCANPIAFPSLSTTYIAQSTNNNCLQKDTFYLNVIQSSTSNTTASFCQGHSYTFPNGFSTSIAGLYHDTLLNYMGCDSFITTNLIMHFPSISSLNAAICQGHSYILPSGISVNTAGSYLDIIPNYHGCDSTISINLLMKPSTYSSFSANACQGNLYLLPSGKSVGATGVYQDTITNFMGCDSIITASLLFTDSSMTYLNPVICQGQNYSLPNGAVVSASGTYTTTFTNYLGCDSTIEVNLVVNPNSTTYQNVAVCLGDSTQLPNGAWVTAGNYLLTFTNQYGCDSLVHYSVASVQSKKPILSSDTILCSGATLNLETNPLHYNGGTYYWNTGTHYSAITITAPGLYIVTATYAPCKSIRDSITVTLSNCDCAIYMPNAFSPNADGFNDGIKPIIECFPAPEEYYFAIYNRWGQQVFSTTNWLEAWDGRFKNTDQEISVFVYYITLKQYKNSGNAIFLKGNITLIH